MKNSRIITAIFAAMVLLLIAVIPISSENNADNNEELTLNIIENAKSSSINLIGKILSNNESKNFYNLYGSIINSVEMPADFFEGLLNKTNEKVLLKLSSNSIQVLDENRNEIYPGINTIDPEEIFYAFSKKNLLELLKKNNSNVVTFEMLEGSKSISVRGGSYMLCELMPCPPFCGGSDE
ncbi:MAG: hypothetical protein HND52_08825 [Ignavibacteriae bacterium]|nr:hypothetical protein [Ignavibacteriota bacterium]NOG98054.1 hypothetical protein [Ignavibacteriota bacterium]